MAMHHANAFPPDAGVHRKSSSSSFNQCGTTSVKGPFIKNTQLLPPLHNRSRNQRLYRI